jgi:hypothetical protein
VSLLLLLLVVLQEEIVKDDDPRPYAKPSTTMRLE